MAKYTCVNPTFLPRSYLIPMCIDWGESSLNCMCTTHQSSCCPYDFIAQVFPSNIPSFLASFSCYFICYILSYPWRYRINILFFLESLCDCYTDIIPTNLYIPHCYLCLCKYFFLQCEFFQWEFILLLLHPLVHCLAHTRFSVNTNVAVTRPSKIPSALRFMILY